MMFLTPEEIKLRQKRRNLIMKFLLPVAAIAIGALIALVGNTI